MLTGVNNVIWRQFEAVGSLGNKYVADPLLPQKSAVLLLEQFMAMPKQDRTLISYDTACHLAVKELCSRIEQGRDDVFTFKHDWVNWLSDQGFYVVLSERDYQIIPQVNH